MRDNCSGLGTTCSIARASIVGRVEGDVDVGGLASKESDVRDASDDLLEHLATSAGGQGANLGSDKGVHKAEVREGRREGGREGGEEGEGRGGRGEQEGKGRGRGWMREQ